MSHVLGTFHTGITVSDMKRSVAFYVEGLGLEFNWESRGDSDFVKELIGLPFESIHNVFLKVPGGGEIELLEYHGIDRTASTSKTCDPATGHLCLYVDDVDAVVAQARRFGGVTRSAGPLVSTAGAAKGSKLVYLSDPDGFTIELFQRLIDPAAADGPVDACG